MTKKHFEAAAKWVRSSYFKNDGEKEAAIDALAAVFNENPRFNEAQFRAACRGEDFVTYTYSGRAVTRRYSKAS